jgi:hypothetical protein
MNLAYAQKAKLTLWGGGAMQAPYSISTLGG